MNHICNFILARLSIISCQFFSEKFGFTKNISLLLQSLRLRTASAIILAVFSLNNAHADVFHPAVFDGNFYINHYPDLRLNGITTEAKAKEHWRVNGLYEGRQAHADFHTKQYLEIYPDLLSTLEVSAAYRAHVPM
ncbi:MAG: hypothetical protein M3Q07_09165 [Pseudobdellovibrionaceae bacterium]|nr:hypothetical protein [Pseudobdellovibrionaceae bacterium]